MIDLYTWTTPNGRKVSIMLEEVGLPYTVHGVDITADEQFDPGFLAISPNNKIPAIVDHEADRSLFESGAILIYLAEKTGMLMPAENRWEILEWLMFQMGGFGPMLGQAHHFVHFNPEASGYARNRYEEEADRLYSVLDERLEDRRFVAGDYSIADIALWPWASRWEWQGIDMDEFENVKRWYLDIAARPAVQKGYHVPKQVSEIPLP
ncbi:MAG: glutathione S-transferase N-terminal domain-containing protein [Gammaproteobacteria bacterium]|nr:glutathione S-transferase N-terminal domain-containing protein [Gammaproteobacteria bacterium]MDE0713287.1 glutathione S-transferase N-terminal domain-containing protein [Gammaproteobacteria bacterium]MXY64240.1 glutathione S-transferase [Gammaproteobacteria bacterium]MYG67048.1 glutathione S-transferase [Gammaproteobacteria bacterium]MYH89437.1 glutathione S-transferase [Gammaproteobacteria bacterium]